MHTRKAGNTGMEICGDLDRYEWVVARGYLKWLQVQTVRACR